MKKNIALVLVAGMLVLGSFSAAVFAEPIPTSNLGREYLLSVPDLHYWSCGAYYHSSERNLESTALGKVKIQRTMAYIGYDFAPWVTTYLTAGVGKIGVGRTAQYGDSQPHYGLGLNVNIIDKDILDPTLIEDKIRVTASLEYVAADTEWLRGEDTRLDELSSSLLVSLVNDIEGNKRFLPYSIGIFGGLLYSNLQSDDDMIEAKDDFGFMGGLEVFYTESVSLALAAQSIGGSGFTGGVNVRF